MINQLFLLRNLIHERTGLFFSDYQVTERIANRLKPRLEESGCKSFSEYYRLLSEKGKAAADEWSHVIVRLSKPVSSFFRHRKQTQFLVDTVIPRRLSGGNAKPLKIWSAGCAAGEEPLAIAIALSEAGWFDRIEIEIYASDANFAAIEEARRGIYSDIRMSTLSSELRLKYFSQVNDEWQVKPELHKRIQWSVTNLINEGETNEFAASQIIFCRNVFIYFSESAIYQTLHSFGKRMPSGGYLFTDGGDYFTSLMSRVNIFERQEFSDASIWMKKNGSVQTRS
jgi:chemotaxis protein methyltransferase CheR